MQAPFQVILAATLCLISSAVHAEEKLKRGDFHIREVGSGVNYPSGGDEAIRLQHGAQTYHVRILHPNVIDGPHFSVAFFWVSSKEQESDFSHQSLVSLQPLVAGLSWHSANAGYFFTEDAGMKPGSLRGFLLVDGQDNADWGATGLLFVYDGAKSNALRWTYSRAPKNKKGTFKLISATDEGKEAPDALVSRLKPILDYAEDKANAWPGS